MEEFNDSVERMSFENVDTHNACEADPSPLKVNLVYGVYKTDDGGIFVLPVVKKAEKIVVEETGHHLYLPLFGLDDFPKLASSLLLGDIEKRWSDGSIFAVQCLGGTGALKVGSELLFNHKMCTTVYYSDPSWDLHTEIFTASGYQVRTYRYLSKENVTIDFKGLCEDISVAPKNSVIILHACCHNPTGLDLSKDQWKIIAEIIKQRKLVPFFDIAYQGFTSSDLVEDAWAIRYFLSEGIEFLCAQSFSKIFTMYNERIGNLTFVLNSNNNVDKVKYDVGRIVRCSYSNPPNHGARTARKIFTDSALYNEWTDSLKLMTIRMRELRKTFRETLEEMGVPGTWNHITEQSGIFVLLNFTSSQVDYMRNVHHIYTGNHGRINLTGLNTNNINYVAKSINEMLRKHIT